MPTPSTMRPKRVTPLVLGRAFEAVGEAGTVGKVVALVELTVYAPVSSTILALLSRPVRWVLRRVVGAFR